ncbi:MAG: hypothetical protein M3548_14995 [Actinomycetota bacterium]|nr:hypothetical protein [Actinomycetota bacterium]
MPDRTCPLGCTPAEPDNCAASLIVSCPLGYWQEPNDVNHICGHHINARCNNCRNCTTCDGCYCGED